MSKWTAQSLRHMRLTEHRRNIMETSTDTQKKMELRRGVIVFVALAVLTVIEYFLGTHAAPTIFLWLIALLKAGLVIWFYMHIQRAFREEGGH